MRSHTASCSPRAEQGRRGECQPGPRDTTSCQGPGGFLFHGRFRVAGAPRGASFGPWPRPPSTPPWFGALPPGAGPSPKTGLGSYGGPVGQRSWGAERWLGQDLGAPAMKSRQKGKKKGSSKERVFGCDLQEQLQRSGQEGKEVAQGCCWVGGPEPLQPGPASGMEAAPRCLWRRGSGSGSAPRRLSSRCGRKCGSAAEETGEPPCVTTCGWGGRRAGRPRGVGKRQRKASLLGTGGGGTGPGDEWRKGPWTGLGSE